MRPLLLLLAAALAFAAPLQAQTPCQNGMAGAYPCNGVDLLARMPLTTFGTSSNNANDIWGWTDAASGREFALVGLENGTAFVEVTTPTAPVYLGRLPTATSSSLWRDIKTYADHAFVVSEASSHGMQVFDLSRLLNVASPPQTFTADARFTGFGSAHNIAIDTESGFAYAVGASSCGGGLYIVDIRNPTSPSQAGCFSGDGYTHDTQCVVYDGPDTDYTGRQICVASNEDSITIVDVTDKQSPVLIAKGFYPNDGYTHQGWFTEDQRFFLVDDELDEIFGSTPKTRTIVFDLQDLDSPEFDFFYLGPLGTSDHNLYVRDGYAFLSNYKGGLRIVDLAGIGSGALAEVASFDTYPSSNSSGTSGQWSNYPFFASGTVVVNDQSNGMFILRPDLGVGQTVMAGITATGSTTVPPTGGPLPYAVTLTNPGSQSLTVDAWVVAQLPDGTEYGPILGPRPVTLAGGQTLGPVAFTQPVPASAPAGVYTVELRVGDYPSGVDASDTFTFTKQAAAEAPSASASADGVALTAYPNPFTDRAAVRFTLDAPGAVRLAVYDAVGREAAVLVDGALPAGPHEAAFDGTDLPNGLYFVLLEAGGRTERRALTLLR